MDIAPTQPRFRTDLVAQPIDESGQRFVDVTDPDSGTTFRFYEVEYSIACAMDGQRDLARLADWAEVELGIVPRPSREELERVVSTLDDLGYLARSSRAADMDLALGEAGAADPTPASDRMPMSADLELGFAGNEHIDSAAGGLPKAPDVGLGLAGNEGLDDAGYAAAPVPVATGEEEDDNEPTAMLSRDNTPELVPGLPPPPAVGGRVEPHARSRSGGDPGEEGSTPLPSPASDFEDEVSVDLSDHLKLGPDAVKEAIRQSKMMSAQGEPADTEAPVRPPKPTSRTTELPDKPIGSVAVPYEPPVEPQPAGEKKSRIGLLVILLLLVVVGALAAEYFLGIIGLRQMLGLENATQTQPVTKEPVVEAPPAPKPPKAKLTAVDAPSTEIKAPRNGALAFIIGNGTEVQEGAMIAKFKGAERLDASLRDIELRREFYQKKLDQAQAKLEQAKAKLEQTPTPANTKAVADSQKEVDKNQAKVDDKSKEVESKEAELAAFIITAPIAGVVETSLAANAPVKTDDVIGSVKPPQLLEASFPMPKGKTYSESAEVELAAGDSHITCTVSKVEGANVTVTCPGDSGVAADTEVTLPLP